MNEQQSPENRAHRAVVVIETEGGLTYHRAVCNCGWRATRADYYRDKAWRRAAAHNQRASGDRDRESGEPRQATARPKPEATWDSPWTDEEEAESNDTDWGPDEDDDE